MAEKIEKAIPDDVMAAAKEMGIKLGIKAFTRKDVEFGEYDGDAILIPQKMSIDEAIAWCLKKKVEDAATVLVREPIDAFVLDGAVAFARVLKKRFGWSALVPIPSFWGDNPPQMIGVPIGYKEVVQVPWGRCQLPGITGYLQTNFVMKAGRPVFELVAQVQRRFERTIAEIAQQVREEVRTNSIYRSRAVRMNFRDQDGDRIEFNPQEHHPIFNDPGLQPQHIDLTTVREEDLIFPRDVQDQVDVNCFHVVRHSAMCRKHGVPLKRGVLLEGPFGVGKTLTAYVLAKACEANGWTFIYLSDVRDLDMAITFGRMYQPAVIFAEDVDKASKGARDSGMDTLLNTLDGVDSKDSEVMVVLTTNEVLDIHKAFLRPGRIDAVVSIRPPDTEATVRMVRRYGCGLVDAAATDEALGDAIQPLLGQNAAFVREAVERAKLSAIAHATGDDLIVTSDDIKKSAISMAAQVALHNKDNGTTQSVPEAFVDAIAERVRGGNGSAVQSH